MTLTKDKSLLAVGKSFLLNIYWNLARENDTIEIWTMPKSWSQILVIPGNQNCDIRNIHWLEPDADLNSKSTKEEFNPLYYKTNQGKQKKRRLITTGLNGQVIEWNL